jgi:uncharacterized protein
LNQRFLFNIGIWQNVYVKLFLKILSLKIICLLLLVGTALSQSDFSIDKSPLPPPTSPVMDYVGILDEATKKSLEKRIIEFRDSTNPSVEIAVCIVPTTGGRDIFEYSLAVARGWGIGSKEDDNPSLLLFIAFNDRKYFTQISRDLEDELPDSLVGQIQRQKLVPAFRQQNYSKGIVDTIEAYMAVIKSKQSGQVNLTQERKQEKHQSSFRISPSLIAFFVCTFLPLIFFLLSLASASRGYSKKRRGYRKSDDLPPFPIIFWGGGSSSGSAWSDSDGGSSWGDWGGFGGGGDFGGGGAGGDW